MANRLVFTGIVVVMEIIFNSRFFGRKTMIAELILIAIVAPSLAFADPDIKLEISATKVTLEMINGESVERIVPAETVDPGQLLTYTIKFWNEGDDPATGVVVNNPIAESTSYVPLSATGDTVEFSADNGETFHPAGEVTYKAKIFGGGFEERQASAERYTHIRWIIGEIQPGEVGLLTYQLQVQQ